MLKKTTLALCLSVAALSAPAFGDEDRAQARDAIPELRHVFLIMMENHSASEILGNTANAPFINKLAQSANVAANYFAVGHRSLPKLPACRRRVELRRRRRPHSEMAR